MWRIHVDPLAVGLANSNINSTPRASGTSSMHGNTAPSSSSSWSSSAPSTTTPIPIPTSTSILTSTSTPTSTPPATTSIPPVTTPKRRPLRRAYPSYPPSLSPSNPPSLAHAMQMQMLAVDPHVFSRPLGLALGSGSSSALGSGSSALAASASISASASGPSAMATETSKASASAPSAPSASSSPSKPCSDTQDDGDGKAGQEVQEEAEMTHSKERGSREPRSRRTGRTERKESKERNGRNERRGDGVAGRESGTSMGGGKESRKERQNEKEKEKERGGVKKFFNDVLSLGHSSSAPIIKTTKTVVQTVTTHHDSYTTPYEPKTEHSTPRDTPRYAIQPLVEGFLTPQLPNEIWLVILKYAATPPFVPVPTGASADPTVKSARTEPSITNPYPYSYSYPYPAALDTTQLASPSCADSSADASAAWDTYSNPRLAGLAPAVSFISAPPVHTQRNVRRAQYLVQWRARVALTSVCRVWWAVGQEVVWQAVWIGSAKDGRKLAGRLCGDSEGADLDGALVSVGAPQTKRQEKMTKDAKSKGRGKAMLLKPSISTPLLPVARMEQSWSDVGRFILHLHIETPAMDRCSPHDLLLILAKCPRLQVFADYRSVRRPMHPLVMGSNEVVPWKASSGSEGPSASRFGTVTRVWAGAGAALQATTLTKVTAESSDGTDVESDEYYDSGEGESDEEYKHPFKLRLPHAALGPGPCPAPAALPRPAHVHGFTSSFGSSSLTTFNHSSSSGNGGYSSNDMAPADALLQAILSKPLKRLTYTNYDHDGGVDVRGGVRYYRDVVEPRLRLAGGGLEYLEVVLSARAVDMGSRQERAWAWGVDSSSGSRGGSALASRGSAIESVSSSSIGSGSGILRNPAVGVYGAANMLTELEARFTTTTTVCTDPMASTATSIGVISGLVSPDIDVLSLPSLRSLKATLDQATFKVLATWDMPVLTHLSVVAADFGYTGRGFRTFFQVHGDKLIQLELGHSSGEIEQYWLTEPPRRAGQDESDSEDGDNEDAVVVDGNGRRRPRVMLDAWCPNLKEFICSADAEWSWETPDWIAPHILLPAHPSLEFIGVRDMSARLRTDMEEHCRRHRDPEPFQLEGYVFSAPEDAQSDTGDAPLDGESESQVQPGSVDPYFMLMQQFGSLLREESFPRLRYLRDLSWESDVIRRTGRMGSGNILLDATLKPTPLGPVTTISAGNSLHVSTSYGPGQPKWWSPLAYTPGKVSDKKTEDAAKTEEATKAALAEARTRSHGSAVLRFWDAVIIMCKHRGVWLEDCSGVNITRNDISRSAEFSAY